jgi:hypothetical protein
VSGRYLRRKPIYTASNSTTSFPSCRRQRPSLSAIAKAEGLAKGRLSHQGDPQAVIADLGAWGLFKCDAQPRALPANRSSQIATQPLNATLVAALALEMLTPLLCF